MNGLPEIRIVTDETEDTRVFVGEQLAFGPVATNAGYRELAEWIYNYLHHDFEEFIP